MPSASTITIAAVAIALCIGVVALALVAERAVMDRDNAQRRADDEHAKRKAYESFLVDYLLSDRLDATDSGTIARDLLERSKDDALDGTSDSRPPDG